MKRIIWGIILSAMPPLVHSSFGVEENTHGNINAHRVAIAIDEADHGASGTVTAVAGGGDEAPTYAYVSANANANANADARGRGEGDRKVVHINRVAVDGDRTGGWLGVSIGQVPDALAAQLNTEGRGLLIENVVKDSPADQAGLQQYDIILSVDGQDVGTDIQAAIESISTHEPGEVAHLVVLRNGEDVPIAVTLGARAELNDAKVEWKYENGPRAVIEDQLRTHGKFMFKDDHGNWVTKDLGDLDELDNLPDNIRAMVPKSGTRTITVEAEDGNGKVRIEVKRNGESLSIKQDNGGPIVVERTDAQGAKSTATYQTPDELKTGDPEAYEVYNNTGRGDVFAWKVDGLGNVHSLFDFDQDFDLNDGGAAWSEKMAALQKELEESLGSTKEAYEKAMTKAERMLQELRDQDWFAGGGDGDGDQVRPLGDHAFGFHPFASLGKPKHTFETRIDGTIEVRIRKGDSELVQLYADEQDLQKRAPDLYEKYEALMSMDTD